MPSNIQVTPAMIRHGLNEWVGPAKLVGGRITGVRWNEAAKLEEYYDVATGELVGLNEDGMYSLYLDKKENMIEEMWHKLSNGKGEYYRVVKDKKGNLKSLSSSNCSDSWTLNDLYPGFVDYAGYTLRGKGKNVKEERETFLPFNSIYPDYYDIGRVVRFNENNILYGYGHGRIKLPIGLEKPKLNTPQSKKL